MQFFPLVAAKSHVGRSPECQIRVDDDEASRQHAVLEQENGTWRITDCDSANGLFVNGQQVKSHALSDGEVVRIGSTLFRFLQQGTAAKDTTHTVALKGMVAGPALDQVRQLLHKAADSDLSVLITGETGTGKELAAQSLHEGGRRRRGPFVAVNCSAIPREILESELFGHVKGAFTGATSDKPGLIRQATRGTLFLDEIGELPAESQAKLLRVLQERQVRPVGGNQAVAVDIGVVSATNRDLGDLVQRGEFRPDLYARIAEMVVDLPPLRERPEDIPLLVQHFVEKHDEGRCSVSVGALEQLCHRRWPFNIRELESAVRRALLLCEGSGVLDAEHFAGAGELAASSAGAERTEGPSPAAASDHPMAQKLRDALERHRGNADEAAQELGISRSQLYRRAKKHGVVVSHFKR